MRAARTLHHTNHPIAGVRPVQNHIQGATPMKAAVYNRYGPPSVVALTEVPKPVAKDNEVLIRIHATTVTTGDWRARSLKMPPGFGMLGRFVFGVLKPRQPILGTEMAG